MSVDLTNEQLIKNISALLENARNKVVVAVEMKIQSNKKNQLLLTF
jgi:hypothetical protein